MGKHVTPFMRLGGVLKGTLPNPQFSAAALAQLAAPGVSSGSVMGGNTTAYIALIKGETGVVAFIPCNVASASPPLEVISNLSVTAPKTVTAQSTAPASGYYAISGTSNNLQMVNPLASASYQGNFSAEVWFFMAAGTTTASSHTGEWYSGGALWLADITGVANDWGIGIVGAGIPVFGVGNPDVAIAPATQTYNDGLWHHVVGTWNASNGNYTLYVDGGLVAASTTTPKGQPGNSLVGVGSNVSAWTGGVACLAIYEVELSAAQVASHFQTAHSTGNNALVANLPTSATTGTRSFVIDATATTFLSIVAGGGAYKVPVVFDGTHWVIG